MRHLIKLALWAIACLYSETLLAYSFYSGGVYYNILNSTEKTVEVTYKAHVRTGGSYSDGYTYDCQSGYSGNVTIPSTVTYNGATYSVTKIGEHAFYDTKTSTITSISIPSSVTTIDYNAFSRCTGLTTFTIPASVSSCNYYAFADCTGIESMNINCPTVPNLSSCVSLKSVTLGENVNNIGSSLSGCVNLSTITIDSNNETYICSDGIVYNKAITTLVLCPSAKTSATILSTTKTIGANAFNGCSSITTLTLPYSVTSIEASAFKNCSSLRTLSMNSNYITSIGESAFYGCSELESFTMPYNVTKIESYTFYGCTNLKIISFSSPYKITEIGAHSFQSCKSLESIDIPRYVTSIGFHAFRDCENLNSVIFWVDASLTTLKDYAFYNCKKLANITLPGKLNSIGNYAFAGCTSLPVEDNVRYADTYLIEAVDNTKSSYKIKNGTKFIGYGAFQNCKALVAINIPSTVKKIDDYAFYGNDALSYVIVNWSTPFAIPTCTFSTSTYSNAVLYDTQYSSSSNSTRYSSVDGWKQFSKQWVLKYKASAVTMNKTEETVIIGSDVDLLATIKAASSYNGVDIEDLVWSSSNEDIASVTSNGYTGEVVGNTYYKRLKGLVHPKTPGKVTITATTIDGSNVSASCEVTVKYPYSLYMQDQISLAGSTPTLPIYMDNVKEICNLQFDITLPEGVDIHYGENEDEEEVYFVTKGARAKTAHTAVVNKLENQKYRVLISSSTNAVFKDTDKSLSIADITLDVDKDLTSGDYKIKLSNAMITNYSNGITTPIAVVDTTMTLTVPPPYIIDVASSDINKGSVTVVGSYYEESTKTTIYGDNLTLTATPAIGYSFSRWTENATLLSTSNPYSFTVSADRTIKAEFTPNNYTVTFVVDGVTYSVGLQTYGEIVVTPTAPVKTGYTFKGWKNLSPTTTVPANDVTFEAVFEINQYCVRFVADGVDVYNQYQDYGSDIEVPEAPNKDRYVFISWGEVALTVPASDVTYTAEYALLGDTYEDNTINVADLTKLVGIILDSSNELTDRQLKIADVYKDQKVNVADYTSLVSLILNSAAHAPARTCNGDSYSESKLNANYANDSISIDIENASNMTALQFDLILPNGYSVSDIIPMSGLDKHTVYSRSNEDGTIRVVVCSSVNDVIGAQSNITIGLQRKNANNTDSEEVIIADIIGATYNSCLNFEDVNVKLDSGATNLCGISMNDGLTIHVFNRTVQISSSKEQIVLIFNANGILIDSFVLTKDESRSIMLSNGVYEINNKKLYIK